MSVMALLSHTSSGPCSFDCVSGCRLTSLFEVNSGVIEWASINAGVRLQTSAARLGMTTVCHRVAVRSLRAFKLSVSLAKHYTWSTEAG